MEVLLILILKQSDLCQVIMLSHVIVAENNKIVLEKQITRSNNKISTKNYYKIDNYDKKEIS